MSDKKWTKEQKAAIETRGCNLLVAAAAGAGKTAVLVQRIIEKITDCNNPVDIDKLLVVTFTNAAASEMRERIGDALSKELEKTPESKNLQKQMTLLNKSSIMTIHSFCLDVIRNNFHLLDIDPDFRIADDTESTLMKQEAIDEIFEDMYLPENSSKDFLDLADAYGGKRDDVNLKDMVLTLYNFSRSMPEPDEWLDSASENFNVSDDFKFEDTAWADIMVKNVKIELEGIRENYIDAIEKINDTEELLPYLPTFKQELFVIDDIHNCEDIKWNDISQKINSLNFESLKRCKKVSDKALQEEVKKVRDDAKKRINYFKNSIFAFDDDEAVQDLKKLYPMMKCLSMLVKKFESSYSDKKRDRGVLDFSDIEHFCIKILINKDDSGRIVPSEAALSVRQRYDEILIDEYQDSNDVQELILTTVSKVDEGNPNIFMVGDVKQSIYRFRQAKPELFLDKYMRYSKDEGADARKIMLFKNFRSRKEVIDGVNYIFKQIMSREIGELDYDEGEMLHFGADYPKLNVSGVCGGSIELNIVETKKDEDVTYTEESEEDEEDIGSIQLEARLVAAKIKKLIFNDENPFYVKKKSDDESEESGNYRRLQYRDIVILLRATQNYAPVFSDELSMAGIPVYADTGTGYFATIEIQTFLALLQIIDNPLQDIPLLAVLRSPMFNFSAEELISIREKSKKDEFYRALTLKAQDDDDTGNKSKNFIQKLSAWRLKSKDMTISEFIWFLYSETGYYAYSAALPGGVQRQANLRILFERAKQFENTSYKGLFNFISFIERLKSTSGDMGSAKVLGENENVVRIMSIHKSKGLEFPVVILSGTGKKFNMMDLNRDVLFHSSLGYGPDFVDTEKRIQYPTILKQAIKQKMKVEVLSEEMRILYVAMTRAKEKLIITGNVRNIEGMVSKWKQAVKTPLKPISKFYVLNSLSYLDFIGPCVMKHKCGKELRDVDENCFELNPIDDESEWEVNLFKRADIMTSEKEETKKEENVIEKLRNFDDITQESGSRSEIEKRLSWKYAYSEAFKMPAVLSVTELKAQAAYDDESSFAENIYKNHLTKRPAFMENYKKIGPAERGSIMHLIMQKLDLNRVSSYEDIKSQADYLVSRSFMTEEQEEAADLNAIAEFFNSPLGKRMLLNRDSVKRETEFNMFVPAAEIYKDIDSASYKEEKILIRGVIDCYFYDGGQIVLVDYKTDYVKDKDDEDKVRERYKVQIEYYEKALEKIEPGINVKEKYLYLFKSGHTLSM